MAGDGEFLHGDLDDKSLHDVGSVTVFCFSSGDPDDMSLRNVEKEVLIPMKMKEKAKHEKCPVEVRGRVLLGL